MNLININMTLTGGGGGGAGKKREKNKFILHFCSTEDTQQTALLPQSRICKDGFQ